MQNLKRIAGMMAIVVQVACGGSTDANDGFVAPDIVQDVSWTETISETGADVQSDIVWTDIHQDTVGSADAVDAALDLADAPSDTVHDTLDAADIAPTVPMAGFGTISGECGVLDDTEWLTATPFDFINHLDFGTATFDADLLSAGGQQILATGTLGGSSIASETFSYEVFYRCEFAELLAPERDIHYDVAGTKKIDYLVLIDGRKVGVSVLRAFAYTPPYTTATATTKLTEKLEGFPSALSGVSVGQRWDRAILSVIAYDQASADTLLTAWNALSVSLKADVILVVTVTDGTDGFIYNQ